MSLFGAKTSIEYLEKELARKEKMFNRLSEDDNIDSLFLIDPDVMPGPKSKPVWRNLHLIRNAMIFQQF